MLAAFQTQWPHVISSYHTGQHRYKIFLSESTIGGAWVIQSVEHPVLVFGSDYDLGIVRSKFRVSLQLGLEPA